MEEEMSKEELEEELIEKHKELAQVELVVSLVSP